MQEEIILDGKKIKVTTEMPESIIKSSNLKKLLDQTIDLSELIKEEKDEQQI